MLGGRRSLAQSHLFDQASAEQRMACVRCLVLHPFIHFLCAEQLLIIGERTARTPSRITFGSTSSSARTSAKRASTRSSIAVPRIHCRRIEHSGLSAVCHKHIAMCAQTSPLLDEDYVPAPGMKQRICMLP